MRSNWTRVSAGSAAANGSIFAPATTSS